tara:strand:- start:203 stop:391 length:189 start_codon:yes stop_codon:yes gene_type:complete
MPEYCFVTTKTSISTDHIEADTLDAAIEQYLDDGVQDPDPMVETKVAAIVEGSDLRIEITDL